MALGGISRSKVVPYVPVDDRNINPDEQTVFWIKPKKFGDSNITVARYVGAEKSVSRKGYREYDARKLTQADLQEFMDIVTKVENWVFSEDFGGDGVRVTRVITESGDLEKVCKDMPNELLTELLEVSSDMSKLNEGEKKSSNSSVFSISGSQKDGKQSGHLSATSVDGPGE